MNKIIAFISLIILFTFHLSLASDTLYETFDPGYDDWGNIYDVNWEGQTFTATANHSVTSVKLQMAWYKGTDGTGTVAIRATDGTLPTGANLCSGTYNSASLLQQPSYTLTEITITSGSCSLTSGTKYAIIHSLPSGDATHVVQHTFDCTSPSYSNGARVYSADSGASWTENTPCDTIFYVYGVATAAGGSTPPKQDMIIFEP